MSTYPQPYGQSLALLTDLYQLTMAYGYWKSGMADREAAFHLIFRTHPFHGGFTVACGLAPAVEFLEKFRFDTSDRAYLATLEGNDGKPLFDEEFLEMLGALDFACDVHAAPEGTVVFPQEPLVRVTGPLLQCQILETALLNIINFQTLIATKAARVWLATGGEPILEFGLRRAQGVDGGLAASRAAYVGGCAGTSNVLAGKLFGIPVRGTHAHSWIMSFDTEAEAFHAYAQAMPNNSIFLVDTYDTLDGVWRAIDAGKWLRQQGHQMVGIRLDSGDLAALSIEARRMLDQAGFPDAMIVASGDLDEHKIKELKQRGATVGVWGVGTRLATAHDDPALGGVYKLSAIRNPEGEWLHKLKLSEEIAKVSNPGMLQVRRFRRQDEFAADVIYDELQPPKGPWAMVDLSDAERRQSIAADATSEDLLVPVFRGGKVVYRSPSLDEIRSHSLQQLGRFQTGVKRFVKPEGYPVGLELGLHEHKVKLMSQVQQTNVGQKR